MLENQIFASPSEALEHHGVKGMKWGVRKERETSSRAGADQKLAGVDPVLVGIGLALAAHVAIGAYSNLRDSGKHHQKKNANVAFKKKPELAKKMDADEILDKVVKPTNPDFPGMGTKMNCRRCTLTYEMRRRGYDVEATKTFWATGQETSGIRQATQNYNQGKGESPWGQKQIGGEKKFPSQASSEARSNAIFSALAQHPEGARGELAVEWDMMGGHSMAWEVVKGKPVIFDAQSSKVYKDAASFKENAGSVVDAAYTRTDNIKLDEHFLKRWMINAN